MKSISWEIKDTLFKNVRELKKYIEIADQRQDHCFVVETAIEKYTFYVDSLSINDLRDEYL